MKTLVRWSGFLGLEILGLVLFWQEAPWFIAVIPGALGLIILVFGPRDSQT